MSLRAYQLFLEQADPLVGLPLVVAGLLLMGFGWRLWKFCVVLSFGLIGWAVGVVISDASGSPDLLAPVGLFALGFVGFRWPNQAVSLLGGIAGSFLVMNLLGVAALLDGAAWWVACIVALAVFTGVSVINRHLVVVFVTSIEGAMLLVSGMTLLCRFSPAIYGEARGLVSGSALVASFLLLVPAAVSVFYQISESNRSGTDT